MGSVAEASACAGISDTLTNTGNSARTAPGKRGGSVGLGMRGCSGDRGGDDGVAGADGGARGGVPGAGGRTGWCGSGGVRGGHTTLGRVPPPACAWPSPGRVVRGASSPPSSVPLLPPSAAAFPLPSAPLPPSAMASPPSVPLPPSVPTTEALQGDVTTRAASASNACGLPRKWKTDSDAESPQKPPSHSVTHSAVLPCVMSRWMLWEPKQSVCECMWCVSVCACTGETESGV